MILVLKNMLKPRAVSEISKRFSIFFIFVSLIFLIIGLYIGIFISPPDYQQGDSVRIMYVHVPAAWMSLICYAFMSLSSALGFIFKIPTLHLFSKSTAPIGACFTLIALLSGVLWGKPTWGVWWVWDARLTSVLVLFFLYMSYIIIWEVIYDRDYAIKISSTIAILGFINLPIIKFSVDWWNTLHQKSSIGFLEAPSIHYSMLIPLCIVFLGFLFYFLSVFLIRFRKEFLTIKIENLHLDLSKE